MLSERSVSRKRNIFREEICQDARRDFTEKKSERGVLHWDSKMMKSMSNETLEMEAILFSCSPHFTEGKLIGIPELFDENGKPSSTGFVQADTIMKHINEWRISNNIAALCCDTTASNMGKFSGAAKRLQCMLKTPLMYHGCRHHVGELLARNCWYTLFEADPSP